ncbi:hypothetical protein [Mycolicibacterium sp. HS_4_1]
MSNIPSYPLATNELWQVPFHVEVWGTVANWFGAFGTVISVGTAAYFYVANLRREEKAQALHISFDTEHRTADKIVARVHNFSDESIFDVTPVQARRHSFRDVLAHERSRRRRILTAAEVDELRTRWSKVSGGILQGQSLDSGHVKAGEFKDVTFFGSRFPAEEYSIEFRDSMARTWKIELDRNVPERVEDNHENCPWWHVFVHLTCFRKNRQEHREIERWLDSASKPRG